VKNVEVGYRGKLHKVVQADVAAFGQDVAHLIANDPTNGLPVFKINRFNYQQIGVEGGVRYYPTTTASAYLNYSFVYSRDKDTGDQIKEFPMHIGGLGGELRLPWRTRLNLDTYWVFAYEPNVTHLTPGAQVPVITNRNENAANQMYVSLRVGRLLYQDKVEVFLMGKNLMGFWRDAANLRMYPSENIQPIGAMVMAGLTLKGN
jgi:hypothetical protein